MAVFLGMRSAGLCRIVGGGRRSDTGFLLGVRCLHLPWTALAPPCRPAIDRRARRRGRGAARPGGRRARGARRRRTSSWRLPSRAATSWPCGRCARASRSASTAWPIGRATAPIAHGAHVHTHNLATRLDGLDEYRFSPHARALRRERRRSRCTFMGYRRADGRVGTRNEIWILCTVGCVGAHRRAHRATRPRSAAKAASTACTRSRIRSAARSSATISIARAGSSPRSRAPERRRRADPRAGLRIESARAAAAGDSAQRSARTSARSPRRQRRTKSRKDCASSRNSLAIAAAGSSASPARSLARRRPEVRRLGRLSAASRRIRWSATSRIA